MTAEESTPHAFCSHRKLYESKEKVEFITFSSCVPASILTKEKCENPNVDDSLTILKTYIKKSTKEECSKDLSYRMYPAISRLYFGNPVCLILNDISFVSFPGNTVRKYQWNKKLWYKCDNKELIENN